MFQKESDRGHRWVVLSGTPKPATPSGTKFLLSRAEVSDTVEKMSQFSRQLKSYTPQRRDNPKAQATEPMAESIPRPELEKLLSTIEGRMDERLARMEKETDRRAGEFLAETDRRAEEFRRELELREAAFQREQALRDKAWDERYAGFLATQTERDKRLDESVAAIRGEIGRITGDIGRLGSLKLNIWGAMLTAVGIGVAIAALSLSFYQTGKADKPTAPPAAITAPPAKQ